MKREAFSEKLTRDIEEELGDVRGLKRALHQTGDSHRAIEIMYNSMPKYIREEDIVHMIDEGEVDELRERAAKQMHIKKLIKRAHASCIRRGR